MSNIDKFISEAKTYFVERGWENETLFEVNVKLTLYMSYFYCNKKTKDEFDTDYPYDSQKYLMWVMEHIGHLWLKHKLGKRKVVVNLPNLSIDETFTINVLPNQNLIIRTTT